MNERSNLVNSKSHIYIGFMNVSPKYVWSAKFNTKLATEIPFTKYSIKETDLRVKTAKIVTPVQLDLTDSTPFVKIVSSLHENFMGVILSDDYKKNSDGTYTYQCQDFSRFYQAKTNLYVGGKIDIYMILKSLISRGFVGVTDTITDEMKNEFNVAWSGLRPKDYYDQKMLGNGLNINPMTYTPKLFFKNISFIEEIRSLTIGTMRYVDVYFDEYGLLQIEPLSVKDWYNKGLQLSVNEIGEMSLKFDTTNAVTRAVVSTGEGWDVGQIVEAPLLTNIFGSLRETINVKNEDTTIKGTTSTNTTTKKTTTNNTGNPYGSKAKKVWINADNGSGSMKNALASALKKKGWTVKVSGTGPGWHYKDYWNVTKDYQCLLMLMNGFCAGTMKEAYSNKIQNVLKKKSVVLVPIWETGGWTNPKGMKPYRYGDFTGYTAHRAWDDNFSSSDPTIKNVSDWLKKNNAKYCCHPTCDGIVKQFLAGGYFASVGK